MQIRKPHHLYFLFLYLSFPVGAQDTHDKTLLKNEISANVVNLKSNYFDSYGSSLYVGVMTGISYSRHLGSHAFRVGLDYRDSWKSVYSDGVGGEKYREGKCNLGYQLKFFDHAVSPYMAVDLIYLLGKYDSDFEGGYAGWYSRLDLIREGIGFAPACGIQFLLAESISISMETNVEFLWISEIGTIQRSDNYYQTNRMTYPVDKEQSVWHWNPVNCIALNYGF